MSDDLHPIEFVSGGLEDGDDLEVRRMTGREELSRLYYFDLDLSRPKGPLTRAQVDALLQTPCVLSLGTSEHDLIHGILESIELLEVHEGHALYRTRLVPGAWLMTLASTNRIFQKTTVANMIESILKLYGLNAGTDYSMLIAAGTEHEYIVQYEESDWDFIQRWLEVEGYYYWFEQSEEGERIVFGDENDDATAVGGDATIAYRTQNNLESDVETIWDWVFRQRRIPARVTVVDHNYRRPHVPLVVTEPTNADGSFGTVFRYNEHFKDKATGKQIAKARAERYLCERRTLHANSDCPRLRVGHKFTLSDHASDDGTYLLTAVDHRGGESEDGYAAVFEAIPIDTQFRPECRTEWPSIHGVIHAHVDADGDGAVAQLDAEGRYKVRLPFDGSGNPGGSSSRWIRKAQPYSGAGYGQHFPLHKGAEVLLVHIDGDPDRPIIVGAVPCKHTPSPVTSTNASQSVVQTASGIRIEMDDQQGTGSGGAGSGGAAPAAPASSHH